MEQDRLDKGAEHSPARPNACGLESESGERLTRAAALTSFLFDGMIGSAAEIDDHTTRGRDMDTRTAASKCRRVSRGAPDFTGEMAAPHAGGAPFFGMRRERGLRRG